MTDKFLNSKKELEKFLKSYDPTRDERLIFTLSEDKHYIIYPEDYIKWNGRFCKYLGFVNNPNTIENIFCFYRIGRRLFYHKASYKNINFNTVVPNIKRRTDDSEFFNTEIKEEDNELMVICKEMLKGIRVNTLRDMFKSPSDYNNVRKEILNGNGRLSWDRFLLICDLLGFDHELKVRKNSSGIIIGDNNIGQQIEKIQNTQKETSK